MTPPRNPCYPNIDPENGPRAGELLGQDCRACGHMVALHSFARGCLGCEMLTKFEERMNPDAPRP